MPYQRMWFLIGLIFLLHGCASSDLSRGAERQIDDAMSHSGESVDHLVDGNIADAYQNSSQESKGLWMGGMAGGWIGAMTLSTLGLAPGVLHGMIIGGALGAYIDAHTTFGDKIRNRGAKVIALGDQVLVVLPSRYIFNQLTPDINTSAYSTLDKVAELINRNPNMMVKIAAYTNATGPANVNLALSQQQASNVLKYLWRKGVDTRVIYAAGYGGTKLVQPNELDWDTGENYRLEITFEKVPV